MSRLAKSSSVVQVNRICVVAKQFECLIMVSVHITHQEVKDGQVHDIQQSSSLIVWTDILDNITVVGVCFPSCFPPLVIASPPGMTPSLSWNHGFTWKECGKAALQHIWTATDGVRCVTIIRTFAVETQISRRRNEKCL